jgi:hypothetical protein
MIERHANDDDEILPTKPSRPTLRAVLPTMAVLALGYILLLTYLHYQETAPLRRLFGGSTGWSILTKADRVEAYRIGQLPDKSSEAFARAQIADFPILNGPVTVPATHVEKLKLTFQDFETYGWKFAKGCIPAPGVRLDFIHGGQRLSVLLCFECDILTSYLDEKLVGGEDFDHARPILVRTVRSLFPDDPKIQSVAEKR